MNRIAIETQHLRKLYNGKVAVADLSLTVYRGEIFGFIGPNGAGKTTAIKMLLGLTAPSGGNGKLLGLSVGNTQTRARIGFLPEHFRFHEWLTAVEFLRFHSELNHIQPELSEKRIPELLALVGLNASADKKLMTFSKGMLQRIGLANALVNNPDLVFLDEPTSGLDPMGRRMVRDIIEQLRQAGTTVFLNSHYLSEVEITCDRVAFIQRGIVVRTESVSDLLQSDFLVEIKAKQLSPEIINGLGRWGTEIEASGDRLTLVVHEQDALPEINRYLVEAGAQVYSFQPKTRSLEELFLQIMGGEGDGADE
jgi:ABC-2 type transport system ATP-binding protein